jgi:small-conductance mechanosensitive channel
MAASLLQQRNALASTTDRATAAAASDAPGTADQLRALADSRVTLTQDERRIRDLQALDADYTAWLALVRAQERTITRRILRSFAILVAILIVTMTTGRVLHHLLTRRMLLDRRRQQTLEFVLSFSVQVLGVLLILVLLFGAPRQTPTAIGLATAGLTVVLKDFIVAFFGWFILMGRNGVRVGDWVEINGISGEVTDVGLLRTTLLETGNWGESGRPTGRRVAFMNSYAIEDHYFNFSTSGQWMWEEIRLVLPAEKDPYRLRDVIRQMVEEVTHDAVVQATGEWHRLSRQHGTLTNISADPIVELRPSAGLELVIRYITRAPDRIATRSRINQRLLEILRTPVLPEAAAPAAAS